MSEVAEKQKITLCRTYRPFGIVAAACVKCTRRADQGYGLQAVKELEKTHALMLPPKFLADGNCPSRTGPKFEPIILK